MEAKRVKMEGEVATRMYRARNRHNREVLTLDLHGLHLEPALKMLADKLVYAAANPFPGRTLVIIITGRGKHSAVKNYSKIRDGVGKFLHHRDNKKRFNLAAVMGAGHCIVELFPKDKTPTPLSHSEFVELSNWPSVRPVLGDAQVQPRSAPLPLLHPLRACHDSVVCLPAVRPHTPLQGLADAASCRAWQGNYACASAGAWWVCRYPCTSARACNVEGRGVRTDGARGASRHQNSKKRSRARAVGQAHQWSAPPAQKVGRTA